MTGLKGTVLITGGAGFLGRGILRRARRDGWDARFVVYSRDEQKHVAARAKYPEARYVVGDILDTAKLHLLASVCDYVIHTAALKYIPECEAQPSEAVRVNIDGTRSVMDAARAAGVKRTVIISTDKAPAPLNLYGMTKAVCERLVFETADFPAPGAGGSTFSAVRYGNVIGSTGSIWPIFKKWLDAGTPLRITEPHMTRFFMGVDDAVELIVASADGPPGVVTIPQPQSVVLGDLAEFLTGAYGAEAWEVVGRRPGEKDHEDMVVRPEMRRMVCALDTYWHLHGPTKTPEHTRPDDGFVPGMRSDSASKMPPEMFLGIAQGSEDV